MIKKTLLILLSIILIAGCSIYKPSPAPQQLDTKEIKILTLDKEEFLRNYGNSFKSTYPNIHLKVISKESVLQYINIEERLEKLYEIIELERPDVMLLDEIEFEFLISKHKLLELDRLINQNHFDIQNISDSAVQLLKEYGNGKIYGLASYYFNKAIFYNKDLFDQYSLQYPTDSMTWEEIFELAREFKRVAHQDQFGFYVFQLSEKFSPVPLVNMIAETNQISFFNMDHTKVTINNEEFKNILRMIRDGISEGYISGSAPNNIEDIVLYSNDMFLNGRAAFRYEGFYYIHRLNELEKPINWDVVAGPVSDRDRNRSASYELIDIFAIHSGSKNIEAAWQLVEFSNSERLTEIKANYSLNRHKGFFTRDQFNRIEGKNMDAFSKLKPVIKTTSNIYLPSTSKIIDEEVTKYLDNLITVDQALENIEHQLQNELEYFLSNQ